MNKDDVIKKLEHLDLPEVELPNHQRRLKKALLNSGYFKEQTSMSLFKKVIPVGGVIAVAVAVIIAVIVFSLGTTPASAQGIAQKSYQAVSNLEPHHQEGLKHTLGIDARTILQEAQNAPDLKVLTYEEFAGQHPMPPDPEGKLQQLKFLQFTKSDGQQVILGIDQNNLPAFTSSFYSNGKPPEGANGEKGFIEHFEEPGSGASLEQGGGSTEKKYFINGEPVAPPE